MQEQEHQPPFDHFLVDTTTLAKMEDMLSISNPYQDTLEDFSDEALNRLYYTVTTPTIPQNSMVEAEIAKEPLQFQHFPSPKILWIVGSITMAIIVIMGSLLWGLRGNLQLSPANAPISSSTSISIKTFIPLPITPFPTLTPVSQILVPSPTSTGHSSLIPTPTVTITTSVTATVTSIARPPIPPTPTTPPYPPGPPGGSNPSTQITLPTRKWWATTFGSAPGYLGGWARVGTLYAQTNYLFCKEWGAQITDSSGNYNHWWLWTDLDTGGKGWVSAYYLKNWGNDVAKDDSGNVIPNCW
jgi:hypothetical protein